MVRRFGCGLILGSCARLVMDGRDARRSVAPSLIDSSIPILIPCQFANFVDCCADDGVWDVSCDFYFADFPGQNKVYFSLARFFVGTQSFNDACSLEFHARELAESDY